MLVQLDIENIAVIEKASVEFGTGLNVITGETGAGKSLLINSLNMVLGERTTKELIRENAEFAKVSAVFFCKDIDTILSDSGIDTDDGNIIISRKLYRDGRNVCHINGSAVNVSLLRKVGRRLVVIHGQYDTGELMDTASHINFLDSFADNKDLLNEYISVYRDLKNTEALLNKMNEDSSTRQNEIDYLTYQTEEIEKADLSEDEEEALITRKTLLENSGSIKKHIDNAYSLLSYDKGAKDIFYEVKRALESLESIDSAAAPFAEKAAELYYETEELSRDISSYMSSIEFNENELREIHDRLDTINTLKRKYNGEISDILKFYEEASERLLFLKSYDENKEELNFKYTELLKEALRLSSLLSETRRKCAPMLSEKLSEELSALDMPKCKIDFLFKECQLCPTGAEHVEFVISTNPSETPKSLSKIASGGEISRIMLAIKSVFSDFDKIPTLLFDEIDTGVSGRAAEKIAGKMRALSEKYQIISVTHLPVIAAAAKNHNLLEKDTDSDSFKTIIRSLSYEERIKEIARIISGDNINDISLKNASQMLDFYKSI